MNALTYDPVTLAYHELRSPLGLVATTMRSMAEDSIDEAVRRRVDVVLRTVERMLQTTERVFVIARGSVVDEAQWFTPAEVAEQVADDLALAGVPVTTEVSIRMPHFGARGVCETLLHSLLSNAGDHHEPGTAIRVTVSADGDIPVIAITNQIATTRRHHGLGAGSYLAQRLAEQAGATLTTERDGAFFFATLRFDQRCDAG